MKTTVAAIDFGTSKIVTLVGEHSAYKHCDIVGVGIAKYDGYLQEGWNNPGALNEAILSSISEAEEQCRSRIHGKIREISVGVPGAFTSVYVEEGSVELKGTDPNVTGADIKAVIEAAERKLDLGQLPGVIIHSSPAWFVVDAGKKTLQPVGLKGRKLTALVSFVVADKFFVDEVNNRLTQLGLMVNGFYSTVAGEAMLFLPEEDRDRTSVLIDVGYLSTDVMVVEGDALLSLATIGEGGAHISVALATALDISLEEAEDKVKRVFTYGAETSGEVYDLPGVEGQKPRSVTHQEAADIIQPKVDEIAGMIQDALDASGIRLGQWSRIYLTGGGIICNKGGKEYLGRALGGQMVREIPKRTTNLNSHLYSSSLGLIDLISTTLRSTHQESASTNGALRNFFRDLLGV